MKSFLVVSYFHVHHSHEGRRHKARRPGQAELKTRCKRFCIGMIRRKISPEVITAHLRASCVQACLCQAEMIGIHERRQKDCTAYCAISINSAVTGHRSFPNTEKSWRSRRFWSAAETIEKIVNKSRKNRKKIPEQSKGRFSQFEWNQLKSTISMYIPQNLQKSSLCAEKNMLSRPFWRLAETKISAGL